MLFSRNGFNMIMKSCLGGREVTLDTTGMARENRQCSMRGNMAAPTLLHGDDEGPIRRRFSGGRRDEEGMTEIELDEDDHGDGERFDGHHDASDAHHQVLEMSATIEILTRDFENLQRELLDAYKKLQEYSDQDSRLHPRSRQPSSTTSPTKVGTVITGGVVSNAMAKLRTGNYGDCGCSHEAQVEELQQIIGVKDTALNEALHERNEFKVRLERAEAMLRESQIHPYDGRSGNSHARSGLHVHTSSRSGSFSGASIPYGMTSTSPVSFTPSMLASSSCASSSASSNKGLPKNERFDTESTYQSKEDDELFWRRQYRDAVRMRKHNGQQAPTPVSLSTLHGGGASTAASAKPSLKIFYPNTNRHKGITDENVPFTRYIGISTRQNEIIKEQHRILS